MLLYGSAGVAFGNMQNTISTNNGDSGFGSKDAPTQFDGVKVKSDAFVARVGVSFKF